MHNQKKRILVFIDWFLPGTNSGGPVRSVSNLIKHLGDSYKFLVITRNTDYCLDEPYKNIKSDSWNKLDEHTEVYYFSKENLSFGNVKKLIWNTEFDTAYVNGIYSPYFSIMPVYILRKLNRPTVVAARGMFNPQAFSVKPVKKKLFIYAANIFGLYDEATFHATNSNEEENIRKYVKNDPKVLVAPNLPRKLAAENYSPKKKKKLKLISVARIAREKGTLIALQALQQLNTSKDVIYTIFGPVYDLAYWNECKMVIDKLPLNIQVTYKGSIESEEVPALLKNYHLFIMPSEGENFGHGILEAFTAGCPVIISNNTPWKNLKDKEIGWNVALNSGEINSALKEALEMTQETYDQWSQNAWNFAREVINDPEVLEANRSLFV